MAQEYTYLNATGVIHYNMTNDYMFRYILQKNQKVLKGLICSLLRFTPEQIKSIKLKNPINLNEDLSSKEFILDIEIVLNDNTYINLEMQVRDNGNWTDRSLSYLCRSFDQLYHGQDYDEALPVIHIGFLDYTLFSDSPEFYSTYKLMNIKNHRIYNDKFILSVVDLSKINLATEEDKSSGLQYWAKIFKAQTWEELKMLVKENEYLQEAAQSIYIANEDEMVKQRCRARAEYERHERTIKRDMKLLKDALDAKTKELEAQSKELEAQSKELEILRKRLAQYEK